MVKRPRTERRRAERAARAIVRDREKLAAMTRGARALPIEVPSSAVIEGRAAALPCIQCEGAYRVVEHLATAGLREVRVSCRTCGAPRTLWFRVIPDKPS